MAKKENIGYSLAEMKENMLEALNLHFERANFRYHLVRPSEYK